MGWNFPIQLRRYGPTAPAARLDLDRARSYCAWMTRTHYENFTVASVLLPRRLLSPFYSIYAYCRWADDLADESNDPEEALKLLSWWRQQLLDCYAGTASHPVMIALQPTIKQFRIPPEPFLNLLVAFERDQRVKEYQSLAELFDYCRYSANPVGHLILSLFEALNPETAALSDSICTGLQLANFWQDVERDYRQLGRIYLPAEERERFGYSYESLSRKECTPEFRRLMQSLVALTREQFDNGRPLLDKVPREARIDIRLFMDGGRAILDRIEALNFDVWNLRPKLGKRQKTGLLLRALGEQITQWFAGFLRGRRR
jgi:squalene synthase HpnC